jgi:hypothetical protein
MLAVSAPVQHPRPVGGNRVNAGKQLARVSGQAPRHLLVGHHPQRLPAQRAVDPDRDVLFANDYGIVNQQDLRHRNAHPARLVGGPLLGGKGGRARDAQDHVLARAGGDCPDLVAFPADDARACAEARAGCSAKEEVDDRIRCGPARVQVFFPSLFFVHDGYPHGSPGYDVPQARRRAVYPMTADGTRFWLNRAGVGGWSRRCPDVVKSSRQPDLLPSVLSHPGASAKRHVRSATACGWCPV